MSILCGILASIKKREYKHKKNVDLFHVEVAVSWLFGFLLTVYLLHAALSLKHCSIAATRSRLPSANPCQLAFCKSDKSNAMAHLAIYIRLDALLTNMLCQHCSYLALQHTVSIGPAAAKFISIAMRAVGQYVESVLVSSLSAHWLNCECVTWPWPGALPIYI